MTSATGILPPTILPAPYRRIALLGILFVVELLAITLWLDGASLNRSASVTRWMEQWGAATLRSVVAFCGLFLVLGYLRAQSELLRIGREAAACPVRWPLFAAHVLALALFSLLALRLYGQNARGLPAQVMGVCWMAAGIAAIVCAGLAFIPFRLWRELLGAVGNVWFYALLAALAAGCFGVVVRSLWAPAARTTFVLVKLMLTPLLSRFFTQPDALRLGTPSFHVVIEPACSGLEGMGLVLIFGTVFLWLFRRDFRFPRAFLLLPIGLVAAFLLNSVRIAALVLIGNAGAPGIALGGFHSQAGWIAFNVVALSLTLGARRIPGMALHPTPKAAAAPVEHDATAAYMLPFLAILAAAMISRSLSGTFEWLYPIRFAAAGAVLWTCRKEYRTLDWRFGWLGLSIGALVFAMWIALDRLATAHTAGATVAGLTPGHGPAWIVWLVLRTLGAVVTVPMAEELAFRGYLLRRLTAADFERVDFRAVTLFALALSSLAFGLMHGARWLAGSLAGLLYALAARPRNRFGESVAAHALTNALLAAWVISQGDWRLW